MATATTIQLSGDVIDEIDLNELSLYMDWNDKLLDYLTEAPGKEAYKLIAYLSTYFQKSACILTGNGLNVLSLLYGCEDITTYDFYDHIPDSASMSIRNVDAVTMKHMHFSYDLPHLLQHDLIIVSASPHDGLFEQEILDALISNGYKGVVLFDNIHLSNNIKTFWDSISLPKWDLTKLGHWSGTGLVIFDPTRFALEYLEE